MLLPINSLSPKYPYDLVNWATYRLPSSQMAQHLQELLLLLKLEWWAHGGWCLLPQLWAPRALCLPGAASLMPARARGLLLLDLWLCVCGEKGTKFTGFPKIVFFFFIDSLQCPNRKCLPVCSMMFTFGAFTPFGAKSDKLAVAHFVWVTGTWRYGPLRCVCAVSSGYSHPVVVLNCPSDVGRDPICLCSCRTGRLAEV